MRSLIVMGVFVAASSTSLTCVAENKSVQGLDASVYVEGSLCKKPDQIVFSCPLAKVKKIVSICAAGNAASHHFYYVFGKPQKIELAYPAGKDSGVNRLNFTKLSFANSWSAVYSLLIQDKKYIVNAVEGMTFAGKSGEQGFRSPYHSGSVLVQKVGEDRAFVELDCVDNEIRYSGKLIENSSHELKPDSDLKERLPY